MYLKLKSWIRITIAVMLCACFMEVSEAAQLASKADDKIVSLPGQPNVTFQQYAGYITVDERRQRALFYYFVEAESDPSSKPLVLWLNGGPGCSSVGAGAFSEHGPFKPSGGAILVANDYSWNKDANMLYLESPAGVGFSYSANASFYDYVNDTITAKDNLEFLEQWFLRFPEYNNNELFITGESYAGHYVPQLAQLIVQSRPKFNLKGIAIGNPLLEFSTDFNAEGDFYWTHGIISDPTYKLLTSTCNTSQMWRESIEGTSSPACELVNTKISEEFPPESFDSYDVTSDVCVSYGQSNLAIRNNQFKSVFRISTSTVPLYKAINQQTNGAENIDLCVQEKTYKYLNQKIVQEALHARLVGISNWTFCSSVVEYDLYNLEIPTINVVGWLVGSGIRVLVFSGDQDSVIPFTGTRTLVNDLAKELRLNSTVPYRAWFVDKQVGGWTQVYGDVLTYATIRGASHMAAFSSPKRSLALFTAFLAGKPLPGAKSN